MSTKHEDRQINNWLKTLDEIQFINIRTNLNKIVYQKQLDIKACCRPDELKSHLQYLYVNYDMSTEELIKQTLFFSTMLSLSLQELQELSEGKFYSDYDIEINDKIKKSNFNFIKYLKKIVKVHPNNINKNLIYDYLKDLYRERRLHRILNKIMDTYDTNPDTRELVLMDSCNFYMTKIYAKRSAALIKAFMKDPIKASNISYNIKLQLKRKGYSEEFLLGEVQKLDKKIKSLNLEDEVLPTVTINFIKILFKIQDEDFFLLFLNKIK